MRAEFLKFVGPKGAGPTEASYLAVLLYAKHFFFFLYVRPQLKIFLFPLTRPTILEVGR